MWSLKEVLALLLQLKHVTSIYQTVTAMKANDLMHALSSEDWLNYRTHLIYVNCCHFDVCMFGIFESYFLVEEIPSRLLCSIALNIIVHTSLINLARHSSPSCSSIQVTQIDLSQNQFELNVRMRTDINPSWTTRNIYKLLYVTLNQIAFQIVQCPRCLLFIQAVGVKDTRCHHAYTMIQTNVNLSIYLYRVCQNLQTTLSIHHFQKKNTSPSTYLKNKSSLFIRVYLNNTLDDVS